MSNDFLVTEIDIENQAMMKKVHDFLKKEALMINDQIDYCAVIYNDEKEIIATISKYFNTIRYLAIKPEYQGFNLTNKLVSYIISIIYQTGFNEVFVLTKPIYLKHFQTLGFNSLYENSSFVFLTNRFDLFQQYLNYLKEQKQNKKDVSIVILNANPFTKGHQHLVTIASKNSEIVYLILVKEDASLFSYEERKIMVKEGIKDLKNVVFLDGSSYLISKSTFPSYFLPSKTVAMMQQTILDANIFIKYITPILEIKQRFVGEEPFSKTTKQYNETLAEELTLHQIKLTIIPRLKINKIIVSATTVRKLFIKGNFEQLALLVPKSTLLFLEKLNYLEYQKKINIEQLVEKNY